MGVRMRMKLKNPGRLQALGFGPTQDNTIRSAVRYTPFALTVTRRFLKTFANRAIVHPASDRKNDRLEATCCQYRGCIHLIVKVSIVESHDTGLCR